MNFAIGIVAKFQKVKSLCRHHHLSLKLITALRSYFDVKANMRYKYFASTFIGLFAKNLEKEKVETVFSKSTSLHNFYQCRKTEYAFYYSNPCLQSLSGI